MGAKGWGRGGEVPAHMLSMEVGVRSHAPRIDGAVMMMLENLIAFVDEVK
jgi:hypothetical protein